MERHCELCFRFSEDLVQCVPAKKGHQILYKGYTYVFKTRLQCGSEQWCCTYRQKTVPEEQLPEWVIIYFTKISDEEQRCNICEAVLKTSEKSLDLCKHIENVHKEVFDLHKDNPEATVGFRIEFLHLNVQDDGNTKGQPFILGEVCEAATEEIIQISKEDVIPDEATLMPKKKKKPRMVSRDQDNRKRSWVWKYFHRMSNIIFKCTLCNVVLSIKGCNTNNMNRHVRTRHPNVYEKEALRKSRASGDTELLDFTEVETPYAIKTEEIAATDKEYVVSMCDKISKEQRGRRSWIWMYFNRTSDYIAQCKLCNRNISHGGNATGNMNRHLKMIHQKTGDDSTWVWKVFEPTDDDYFICKICQYRCIKFTDVEKSVSIILQHLRVEHGVVSGDQIITGADCDEDNLLGD